MSNHCYHFIVCTILLSGSAFGQSQQTTSRARAIGPSILGISQTIHASEGATSFEVPIVCDSKCNVFLKNTRDGVSSIHELSAAGERVAEFTAAQCPDISVHLTGPFAVGSDNRVYQIVFPEKDRTRWLAVFDENGSCRSKIKLNTGFFTVPYQIATFPSGKMLIAGLRLSSDREVQAMWPYTGLYSASGDLLKLIELEDDTELHVRAAEGDPRIISPINPHGNNAVTRGAMLLAKDGNVYLMRRTSPAIIYAISDSGVVVRRFTVDPGEADLLPGEMHVSGNRIAIFFRDITTRQTVLKVVDLEGKEIASYTEAMQNGVPDSRFGFRLLLLSARAIHVPRHVARSPS